MARAGEGEESSQGFVRWRDIRGDVAIKKIYVKDVPENGCCC